MSRYHQRRKRFLRNPVIAAGYNDKDEIKRESVEDAEADDSTHIIDPVKGTTSQHVFTTAQEVDAYLREERDSWDR